MTPNPDPHLPDNSDEEEFDAGEEILAEILELSAHGGRRSLRVEPGDRGQLDGDVASQHRLEEPAGDAVAQPLAGDRATVDEPGADRGGELGSAVPFGGAQQAGPVDEERYRAPAAPPGPLVDPARLAERTLGPAGNDPSHGPAAGTGFGWP